MTRWAERAKAAISQTGLSVTAKTDERVAPSLLSVSSVPNKAIAFSEKRVLSVSSVPVPADVEKKADLNYVQIPTKISRATYDGDPLLEELLDLGNQICNYWGDSEAARDKMRLDILSYPPHQRGDLMTALEGSLRANKPRGSHEDDRVMCRNWKQAGVAQKASKRFKAYVLDDISWANFKKQMDLSQH